MKRLLDDTPDELVRSLLQAGLEHRPPPGSKAKVVAALGAGGAVGLLSSKAFAWLGTGAGKLGAWGVTLSIVGALYVTTALEHRDPPGAARAADAAAADVVRAADVAHAADVPAGAAGAPARALPAPKPAAVAAFPVIDGAAVPAAPEPAAGGADDFPTAPARATPSRKRWRKPSAATAAAPAVPQAVDSATAVAAQNVDLLELDAEVELVDRMRVAARGERREQLARLVQEYRAAFPHGQLREEVFQFERRLLANAPAR